MAFAFTRSVHVVRITNPQAVNNYVDVEVVDAIAVVDSDGNTTLYSVAAKNAVPYIVDSTGDGPPTIGQLQGASRVSHMVRLQNPNYSQYFIDVEVLDAFTMTDPYGNVLALVIPSANAVAAVVDNTGNGLSVPISSTTTRKDHIVAIYEVQDLNTTQATGTTTTQVGGQNTGPNICVELNDFISFGNSNNYNVNISKNLLKKGTTLNVHLVLPTGLNIAGSLQNATDTTDYSYDINGNPVPPPNTDPNIYVRWPQSPPNGQTSQGAWVGPTQPVKQGPLWFIKDTNVVNPWYYYMVVQQPTELSEWQDAEDSPAFWFVGPYEGASHIFPHNFGGPSPFPVFPLPQIGYSTINDAALAGQVVPIPFLQSPLGLNNYTYEWALTEAPGPNIWEITGLQQPMDAFHNPLQPSPAQAEQAATALMTMWNSTSDAFNDFWAGISGLDFPADPTIPEFPGDWQFPIPLLDPSRPTGYPSSNEIGGAGFFIAGLPPNFAPFGAAASLGATSYGDAVYAASIAVGQLDPTQWNTTQVPPVPW